MVASLDKRRDPLSELYRSVSISASFVYKRFARDVPVYCGDLSLQREGNNWLVKGIRDVFVMSILLCATSCDAILWCAWDINLVVGDVNGGLESISWKGRSSGCVVVVLPLYLLGAVFVLFLCSQLGQLLLNGDSSFFSQLG